MSRILPALLASSVFVLPAAAQEVCGISGGQWIGGGEAGSDISTAAEPQEQMALVLSGNTHVSLFSLSAPTDVRIEAAGRGNGDPAIEVLDADGTLVAADDDSGGNGASRAELSLGAGTYCVTTSSYDGSPMTAFVRVGRVEQDALTNGTDDAPTDDTGTTSAECSTAPMIGTVDGMISATGSVDENRVWRFALGFDAPISITAENEAADPTILLTNAAGDFIAENDDHDGLNSRIDVTTPLPAGEYCLEVDALSDSGQPISLTVDIYDPQAALAALFDRGEAAPPMDGTVPITDLGALQTRLRQDAQVTPDASWYSFDIPEAGLVVVEAIGAGGNMDPWIALYDDLGRQVALNDDFGDSLNSQITARVSPGTYLLAVKEVGDNAGFVRMLVERYVPAQ